VSGVLGEQALAELRRRIPKEYALPERGTDILRLEPMLRERFALIRRPMPELARLLAAWEALYRDVRVVAPPKLGIVTRFRQPGPLGQNAGESQLARAGLTRWGASRNWSGAVILARDAERVRRVTASWVVPEPALPSGEVITRLPRAGAWQSSTWIGLDGYRLASRGLPQIGTVSEITAGGPKTYAWTQWWVRGAKLPPATIQNLEVRPGDRIVAAIDVSPGWAEVRFSIRCEPPPGDPRLIETRDFPMDCPVLDGRPVPVEGNSAVWCTMERPLTLDPTIEPPLLFPLPALGPVTFRDAVAGVLGRDGLERERDLTAAKQLRMIARGEGGEGLRRLASPRAPARAGKEALSARLAR
jgi:hypothetical protein